VCSAWDETTTWSNAGCSIDIGTARRIVGSISSGEGATLPQEWAPVEELVRALGNLRVAAESARGAGVDDAVRKAIETAIREATDVVLWTMDRPGDADIIAVAWEAVEVGQQVIGTLHAEAARSLQLEARASELRRHAADLIAQARRNRGNGPPPPPRAIG
jgi:hypothetical protein